MKHNYRIPLVICLALVVLLATSAFTTTDYQDDKVVFGGTYVLHSNETINGNLVILGGAVTLEQNSIVTGDTALFGGTLDADGMIRGNLTIIGGVVRLTEHAVINGDVFTLGGSLERASGSQILGNVNSFGDAPFSVDIPNTIADPEIPVMPFYRSSVSLLWKVIYYFGMVIFTAAMAMLVALLWARPTQRVANAIRMNPIGTGGFGCLTLIVAPGLLVLVAITIILSPLSLLGMLLLMVAVIFGWTAINLEVGNRLSKLFNVAWSAPIAAGIGALVFNLVIFGLAMVPCIGWALVSLVLLFALGGVLLTRFGTHDYPEVPTANAVTARPVGATSASAIQSMTPVYPEVVKSAEPQVKAKSAAKPAKKALDVAVKPPAEPIAKSKEKAAKAPAKPAAKPKAKAVKPQSKVSQAESKPASKTTAKKPAGTGKSK
ncbi:MAG: polymer-forming cytoskeletal protein [Anaerolineaceae bacterium]|nr:polymer-forming cytoskeletal protein [Anaerolineaceae bacterium]MBN2678490.1 polymer-forming cytoskeletal protein [Anaerolineaceae bacterium]